MSTFSNIQFDPEIEKRSCSPPRECLDCRLYKADKGSNDDLVRWSQFNKLLHRRKENGEVSDHNLESPASESSMEGNVRNSTSEISIRGKRAAVNQSRFQTRHSPTVLEENYVHRNLGTPCCSDSDDGHEKRSIPDENNESFKRRRTLSEDGETPINDEVEENKEMNEKGKIRSNKAGLPGRILPEITFKGKHSMALNNAKRNAELPKERIKGGNTKRIGEFKTFQEKISLRSKVESSERPRSDTNVKKSKASKWVRKTVVTALSNGTMLSNDANTDKNIVAKVNKDHSVYFATIEDTNSINDLLSRNDTSEVSVTTVEKSLHKQKAKECSKRVFKKTVIKIEKNNAKNHPEELSALQLNKPKGDILTGFPVRSFERINCEKELPLFTTVACTDEDCFSNRTRPSTALSFTTTRTSETTSFPKTLKKVNTKSSKSNDKSFISKRSTTLLNISRGKSLYEHRLKVSSRNPTPVMQVFADQVQKSIQSRSRSKCSSRYSDDSDIPINNVQFDFLRPHYERRIKSCSLSSKQKKDGSLSRPRSVSNATPRHTPPYRSETDNSSVASLSSPHQPSSVKSLRKTRQLERPPSRKPAHLSPGSMKNSNEGGGTTSGERISKNKYTLKTNIPRGKIALRSTIEENLKVNRDCLTNADDKNRLACIPTDIDDYLDNTLHSCVEQGINKRDLTTQQKAIRSRLITHPVRPKTSPSGQRRPLLTPNDEDDNELKQNWNKFSAPDAIAGHPLKCMTLAEYQEKRRRYIKRINDESEQPPQFVKSSRVVSIFKIWEKDENRSNNTSALTIESTTNTSKSKTNKSGTIRMSSTNRSNTISISPTSRVSTFNNERLSRSQVHQTKTISPPWNYNGFGRNNMSSCYHGVMVNVNYGVTKFHYRKPTSTQKRSYLKHIFSWFQGCTNPTFDK